ncbi:hypothetical protein LI129_18370, partial [Erysipelatoclostridium ramosum]|nr:hypothetical protein [Thomasclavelia ramosa]
ANTKRLPKLSQNGSLQKLLQELLPYVYKEDRLYFENFWNLTTLKKRITLYTHVTGSFRLLLDGTYRWMKFQITASTNEQLSDTYLCLIDNMAKKLQKPAAPKDHKLHYDELTNLYE